MDTQIMSALITASAAILAAIISGFVAVKVKDKEIKAKEKEIGKILTDDERQSSLRWWAGGGAVFGMGATLVLLFVTGNFPLKVTQEPSISQQPILGSQLPNGTTTPMPISSEARILIDNSRECGEVLTMEQARRNNPEHPEYAYAGDLAIEIKKLYPLFDMLNEKPIRPEKLKDYRVLVLLSNCDGYSSQEIIAIENFVRSGGRVLILGSIDNFLLSQFGIRYVGTPIEFNGGAINQDYQIPVNSSDPILKEVPDLFVHAGTVLEVQDSSTVILWTPKNAYLDANINWVQENGEKKGPFPMVVKMKYGEGYVVATANRPIWAFGYDNNYLLVLNAIQWLINQ